MTRRLSLSIAVGCAVGCAVLCPRGAAAEDRPTVTGGLWSFAPADIVESWEPPGGRFRVHYSVEGPHATRLLDADEDGIPDFAQDVAHVSSAAIDRFVDVGFRAPLLEAHWSAELGGSPALDVYLIDFGGAADGRFGVDTCDAQGCGGFVVIENDFFGYGYPTLEVAIDTVASHEGFHAVQAAYAPLGALPTWASEGTATWAERLYDEDSEDFVRLCNGYLAQPHRPVFQPPSGPVPAFAYGTALWFDYATRRHGVGFLIDLFDAWSNDGARLEPHLYFESELAARDDALEDAWVGFVQANLASGPRSGAAPSHPYASQLAGIEADHVAETLAEDTRFYPLAATYWSLQHPGGTLWSAADEDLGGVEFSLHPVAKFASDGPVGEAIAQWQLKAGNTATRVFEELPAGGYWIVGTLPEITDGPARAVVCVGPEDHVQTACEATPAPTGTTTGGSGDGSGQESTTGPSTDSGDPSASEGPTSGASSPSTGTDDAGSDTAPSSDFDDTDGCACRPTPRRPGVLAVLVGLWLGVVRRRRRRVSP